MRLTTKTTMISQKSVPVGEHAALTCDCLDNVAKRCLETLIFPVCRRRENCSWARRMSSIVFARCPRSESSWRRRCTEPSAPAWTMEIRLMPKAPPSWRRKFTAPAPWGISCRGRGLIAAALRLGKQAGESDSPPTRTTTTCRAAVYWYRALIMAMFETAKISSPAMIRRRGDEMSARYPATGKKCCHNETGRGHQYASIGRDQMRDAL